MTVELLLAVVGSVVGNLGAQLIRELRTWFDSRRKLREVREEQFVAVLNSGSLRALGDYLDGPIADFSVREYADNGQVRSRVNKFITRLEDFVGSRDEVNETPVAPKTLGLTAEIRDPELTRVATNIEQGHVWDALATLRRIVETRLRGIALRHEIAVGDSSSATRFLTLLRQRGLVSVEAFERLRYAISVANRGVHGLEVSTAEAVEALLAASTALMELGNQLQSS
jgi:hypothetical protein